MNMTGKITPQKNYWILDILDVASKQTEDKGVRGSLKMEKISVLVRENLAQFDYGNWDLVRNFRGPTDPGLSRLLQAYHDLDIIKLERIRDGTLVHRITDKGRTFLKSLNSYFSKIDPNFEKAKKEINENILQHNIKKSGNELVGLKEIQDLKKKILGKKI